MSWIPLKRMTVAEAIDRFVPPAMRDVCTQCAGRGYVKQWIEGKPHTAHMGRCEQCSGFGKVRA